MRSGGGRDHPRRIRLFSAAIVAVLGLSVLSACTGQGDAAAQWFSSHDIVESVDVGGVFSGVLHSPSVEAVIKDDATSDQVRQLAIDAVAYQAEHNSPATMYVTLSQHDLSMRIASTVEETLVTFESWDLVRADARAVWGLVDFDHLRLSGARSDLVDLAVEFGDLPQELVVHSDQGGPFSLDLAGCELDSGGAAFASALLADDAVAAASISLCSDVTLATASPEDLIALASRVALLSDEFSLQKLDTRVVYDDDPKLLFRSSPAWQIFTSGMREGTQRLLTRVFDSPTTDTMWLDSEGQLRIVVEEESQLREAALAVFVDADLTAVNSVQIRSTPYKTGATLEASTLAKAESGLSLLEQLAAQAAIAYAVVTPSEIGVWMADESFTEAHGIAAIDLILASKIWMDRTVSIADRNLQGLVVVHGVPQPNDNSVAAALREYWLAHARIPVS